MKCGDNEQRSNSKVQRENTKQERAFCLDRENRKIRILCNVLSVLSKECEDLNRSSFKFAADLLFFFSISNFLLEKKVE